MSQVPFEFQFMRAWVTNRVRMGLFVAALVGANASAKGPADQTIPAMKQGACGILLADQDRAVREAIYKQIVKRASDRLNHILPGARLKFETMGPDISITATGVRNGNFSIKGRAAWLKRTKVEDLDYLPGYFEESGPDPLLVFAINEIRVQDYEGTPEDQVGRFRRLGIGTLLLNAMAEITRVAGVQRLIGRLDQTNKFMFCEKYEETHDPLRAADYSFMGQVLNKAGYRVDVENSLVAYRMRETCENSSLYITWVR